MIELNCEAISRPLRTTFSIARGSKTSAECLVVQVTSQGVIGRGEAVPYTRYQETMDNSLHTLKELGEIELSQDMRLILKAGAARNALDCAMWDLRAKILQIPVWKLLDLPKPMPVQTAQTLPLASPKEMAEAAAKLGAEDLIKIKLGAVNDLERMRAIRNASPKARLIIDANEGWSLDDYNALIGELQKLGVEMIEQPFPEKNDGVLQHIQRPIAICADESSHESKDVALLKTRYDMINIKLDKTGGLTEAAEMVQQARSADLPYMIGCMVGSSLSMAPAFMLASDAAFVDLDGPLFLKEDESPAIVYQGSMMYPPSEKLWGM